MPIYEYLCPACNRVFNFLSPTVTPKAPPTCPKCGRKDLRKLLSRFAVVGATRKSSERQASASAGAPPTDAAGGPEMPAAGPGAGADDESPFDNPRVERDMERLMADADGIDENDPRQLGRLMRRMSDITGEKLDHHMETAIRRLEKGEDPEKIEEDMGDVLGGDEGQGGPGAGPAHDDGLYPM